mgnify:CR=1 FL=1
MRNMGEKRFEGSLFSAFALWYFFLFVFFLYIFLPEKGLGKVGQKIVGCAHSDWLELLSLFSREVSFTGFLT